MSVSTKMTRYLIETGEAKVAIELKLQLKATEVTASVQHVRLSQRRLSQRLLNCRENVSTNEAHRFASGHWKISQGAEETASPQVPITIAIYCQTGQGESS